MNSIHRGNSKEGVNTLIKVVRCENNNRGIENDYGVCRDIGSKSVINVGCWNLFAGKEVVPAGNGLLRGCMGTGQKYFSFFFFASVRLKYFPYLHDMI